MRWWRVLAAVSVLVVAGCAGSRPVQPVQPGRPGTGQPTDLVGLWRLEADGEDPGTILRLGSDLSIWRRCGELFGGWTADAGGAFVGDTSMYSYECGGQKPTNAPKAATPDIPPTPAWLTRAVRYRADGVDRLLLDQNGAVVARLLPGTEPTGRTAAAHDTYAAPTLDAELTRRLSPAAPPPAGLRPATRADLIGTWAPSAAGNPKQYVTLAADGSWTGSDGCNSGAGRWTLDTPGVLLTVSGPQTLVGCDGQDRAPRLEQARGAGFTGATLVLTDAQGSEVSRLVRRSK